MSYDKYLEQFVKPHIRRRLDRLREQYARQKIVNADSEKIKSLVAKLGEEDTETRRKAALALGDAGKKWAILPLAEAYYGWQNGDCLAYWQPRPVQFAIGLALLELGQVDELVDCLSDDSGFINPSRVGGSSTKPLDFNHQINQTVEAGDLSLVAKGVYSLLRLPVAPSLLDRSKVEGHARKHQEEADPQMFGIRSKVRNHEQTSMFTYPN